MRDKGIWVIFLSYFLASCNDNSVRVNDQFSIGYLEMYNSISLSNDDQGFVSNVSEAYWNSDSLVLPGDGGCYLLKLKTIKYNDEMIRIECGNLSLLLKKGEIKRFIRQ
ncbi:hypothetical protein [Desertivirga arenae]|uniref:hypothetical protein n=1 Tax=Desertivirga arenae TaxID=2810309 RepID=UPI001A95A0E9|nr:hypothetical protein [Pedobacter sp. SYSU D00823]